DGIRRRAAPPANRVAGANEPFIRHRGAPVGALGGEPVEDASPERGECIGRNAAAKAPPPESRRSDDRDAARWSPPEEDGSLLGPRAPPAWTPPPAAFALNGRKPQGGKVA